MKPLIAHMNGHQERGQLLLLQAVPCSHLEWYPRTILGMYS
jgi:hypothetical protein